MPRVQQRFVVFTGLLVFSLSLGACSCDSNRRADGGVDGSVAEDGSVSTDASVDASDASSVDASDASLDASVDSSLPPGAVVIHRNVAGGGTARSSNYQIVRTHGRGVGASSMSFTHRDGVHGGVQP